MAYVRRTYYNTCDSRARTNNKKKKKIVVKTYYNINSERIAITIRLNTYSIVA